MSVYGLKFRRTDPSDSVASMFTYSASSRTSMLRRQRRTIRVLAISKPPQRGLHLDALWPDQWSAIGCGVTHISRVSRTAGQAFSARDPRRVRIAHYASLG